MPIQLDKILSDIAEEKVLHPNYPDCGKKQVDDAWMRVGKKNKLSVHEARSIFKVLQKKYEQERVKESSAWKLFSVMDEIHKKVEIKPEVKHEEEESDLPVEEDEEYEMLEVQEEEEHAVAGYVAPPLPSTGSASDGESPNKSFKSNSSSGSPEKDDKALIKTLGMQKSSNAVVSSATTTIVEEKKILNSMPTGTTNKYVAGTPQTPTAATAAALQKKGITMKKTTSTTSVSSAKAALASAAKTTPVRSTLLEVGKTTRIQLPESLKRKLSEDHSPQQQKRASLAQAAAVASVAASLQQHHNSSSSSSSKVTTQKPTQSKHELEEVCQQQQDQPTSHGINLITIPANPTRTDLSNGVAVGLISNTTRPSSSTAATVASTSTNGFSPRIEDIDFRNDIIFDTGTGNVTNGGAQQSVNRVNHQSTEIINLGNFDNSLPPTFFKNLCNSSRHEALGLYVANVMNRLGIRAAAKLELGILRAIIDVQSDELEQ